MGLVLTPFPLLAWPSVTFAFVCCFASSLIMDNGVLFLVCVRPAMVYVGVALWIWSCRRGGLTAGDRFALRWGYYVLLPLTTAIGFAVQHAWYGM